MRKSGSSIKSTSEWEQQVHAMDTVLKVLLLLLRRPRWSIAREKGTLAQGKAFDMCDQKAERSCRLGDQHLLQLESNMERGTAAGACAVALRMCVDQEGSGCCQAVSLAISL